MPNPVLGLRHEVRWLFIGCNFAWAVGRSNLSQAPLVLPVKVDGGGATDRYLDKLAQPLGYKSQGPFAEALSFMN